MMSRASDKGGYDDLADWLSRHAPAGLADSCAAQAATLRANGAPALQAWLEAAGILATHCQYGATADALERVLALAPDKTWVRVKLAWARYRDGDDNAALAALAPITPDDQARPAALVQTLEMTPNEPGAADLAGRHLLALAPWAEEHEQYVATCCHAGLRDEMLDFLLQWMGRHGSQVHPLMRAGEALLEAGEHQQAHGILTVVARAGRAELETMIGDMDGPSHDCPAAEAEILRWIADASTRSESDLPVHRLAVEGAPDPGSVQVLYAGPQRTGWNQAFPNDCAEHFMATAAVAGGHCTPWLDTGLTNPAELRMPGNAAERRFEAFAEAIASLRPDVVLLDLAHSPDERGLCPARLGDLKRRQGFRIAFLVRDPLKVSEVHLHHWQGVADSMVVADPAAYFLADPSSDLARKSLVLPVPAMHSPFITDAPPEPRHGLLFAGSTSGIHRSIVASMLAVSGEDCEIVLGQRRRELAPDQASFAHLLGQSRAVLNFSAHHPGRDGHLVTGRVWETIAARSLLIEQENPGTMAFFAPWRHFIPWRNPADIIRRWRVLSRHEELRRRIAEEGHDWARRHYGPERVWRALINHALRPLEE